jgi:hypothetical protein
MRSTLAAFTIVLSAGAVTAQGEKKYESKEGKYSIAFPSKPMPTPSKAGGVELNMMFAEKGDGGFIVMHADFPAEMAKLQKPKELLDNGQKGLVEKFEAKVATSKDFEFGKQKYPAREIVCEKKIENGPIYLRIQIIVADNRLYQVFVVGPKEMVTNKEADTFFKSFEITK